jgi:hypothetical protein
MGDSQAAFVASRTPWFSVKCLQAVVFFAISSFFGTMHVACGCLDTTPTGVTFLGSWFKGDGRGDMGARVENGPDEIVRVVGGEHRDCREPGTGRASGIRGAGGALDTLHPSRTDVSLFPVASLFCLWLLPQHSLRVEASTITAGVERIRFEIWNGDRELLAHLPDPGHLVINLSW